ncbi:MAG: hypothetical protein WCO56_24760, partial [Verrucomicrobiota bacterium]
LFKNLQKIRIVKSDRLLDQLEARLAAIGKVQEDIQTKEDFARLEREALAANPLVSGQPLLFVVRHQYKKDHHNTATFFPSAQHECNTGTYTPGGELKVLDLSAGGVTKTLIQLAEGVVRDPEVHFDGRKILFSMRTNVADSYHLYEIEADGNGLRQLTFARDVDDLDPLYLPDGGIAFSSTREPKYCMCNRHIMANLYRMEGDGANIHQIGKSTLFEGHGSLMPDGRILYDRWEYVDRNFGDAQALWTVNPDGTSHALYWGNNTASPGGVLEGRIIPGTTRAVCVFSSCHDRPWGAIAIVDPSLGMDGSQPVVHLWPASATNLIKAEGWQIFDSFARLKVKYEDPYPLNDRYFLCARMTGQGEQMGIYLLDTFGNEVLLHTEEPGCFDPMPVTPRPRPPVIPTRRYFDNQEGSFYVQDVYQGTHMQGVPRGSIKWLRVVESPEKRFWTGPGWDGQGQEAPAMNWHDFSNKRILGTVPVAEDGSVAFAVPADKFVYFQLLDARGMMVQSMRSGTMAQSGEQASCVGCHEDRRSTPLKSAYVVDTRRPPMPLAGWHGPPREFSYRREVQPVFDRWCVSCHDFGKAGGVVLNLAGDRDLVFNASYNELWRKKFITVVGAGPAVTQPAYWGSPASKLVKAIRDEHCGVKLSPEDFERIVTWIDLNAPYYPSYASAHPANLAGRSPLDGKQLKRLEELTGLKFGKLASHAGNQGPQISFDRPELSPCLEKISDHQGTNYLAALEIIRAGRQALNECPEADAENFTPCELDQWREQKYVARRQREQANRQAIRDGRRVFDRAEW